MESLSGIVATPLFLWAINPIDKNAAIASKISFIYDELRIEIYGNGSSHQVNYKNTIRKNYAAEFITYGMATKE